MKRRKETTSNIEHRTSNAEGWADDGRWQLHDGNSSGKKYDLEERPLEFAAAVIDLSEKLPTSRAGNHVAGQILRSGTSSYPNHGEAESTESREDFIHKLKVCHKELRETRRWGRLIHRKRWAHDDTTLIFILSESEELIRIFMSSIRTARPNALKPQRGVSSRTLYDFDVRCSSF